MPAEATEHTPDARARQDSGGLSGYDFRIMAMQCNIDAKGKFVRLMYGLVLLIAGIVMLVAWALPGGSLAAWVVSIACIIGGGFAIFESWAGWCVVRAFGFKTPM